jgi:hypothetical protein
MWSSASGYERRTHLVGGAADAGTERPGSPTSVAHWHAARASRG